MVQNVTFTKMYRAWSSILQGKLWNVVGQFIILKVNLRKAKSYMVKYTCLGCFIYGSFRAHTCLYALIITKDIFNYDSIHIDKRESYGLRIINS